MKNKDKYLKDGVEDEFIKEVNNEMDLYGGQFNVEKFLSCEIKPTLTEDEKVILKSIKDDNWAIIGKTDFNELYLANYCKNNDVFVKEIFKKDLFQFIKPRRRI